jgi:general secretion pathway protein J
LSKADFDELSRVVESKPAASLRRAQSSRSQLPEASCQKPETGFTLMEVLVAIAILAIVVTTILASFNAVFSTTEVLDESADIYAMAKNCMKRMIRFASRAHIGLENSPREGIAEIIYYVQPGDEGHPVLKRTDNLYPYPDFEERGSDPVLSKYVKSLAFKFYDEEGLEYDVWDSDSDEFGYATPKVIAIRLELANKSTSQTFETRVFLPLLREKTE